MFKHILFSDIVPVFQVIVDDGVVEIVQVSLHGFFILLFQSCRESAPDQVVTDFKAASQLSNIFFGFPVYKGSYTEGDIAPGQFLCKFPGQ